jgi:hypothetical protein
MTPPFKSSKKQKRVKSQYGTGSCCAGALALLVLHLHPREPVLWVSRSDIGDGLGSEKMTTGEVNERAATLWIRD